MTGAIADRWCAAARSRASCCWSCSWPPGNGGRACSEFRTFIVPPLSMVYRGILPHAGRSTICPSTPASPPPKSSSASCSAACSAPSSATCSACRRPPKFALSPYILALQIAPKVAFAPLVHPVDGLHHLSEDPGGDPDRVLSGDGQCADGGAHGRSRPDQSGALVQGDARADLLEDRISGFAAAAVRRACASARRWRWSASWSASWSAAIPASAICWRSAKARPTRRWCSSPSSCSRWSAAIAYLAVILLEQRVLHYMPNARSYRLLMDCMMRHALTLVCAIVSPTSAQSRGHLS